LESISVFKEYKTIKIRPNRLIKADMITGGAINNVINATIETATHKACIGLERDIEIISGDLTAKNNSTEDVNAKENK
jgi:hypothetical protein